MPRIRWFGNRYIGPLFDVDSPAGSSPAPAPTDPPAPVDPPAAPPAPVDPPADPPADEDDDADPSLEEFARDHKRWLSKQGALRVKAKALEAEVATLKTPAPPVPPAPADPAAEATARAASLEAENARLRAAGSAGVPLTAFEAAQQLLAATDAAGLTAAWQALTAAIPAAAPITPPPITPGSPPKAEGLAGALAAHFNSK